MLRRLSSKATPLRLLLAVAGALVLATWVLPSLVAGPADPGGLVFGDAPLTWTIFITPQDFVDTPGTTQRRAIQSWLHLEVPSPCLHGVVLLIRMCVCLNLAATAANRAGGPRRRLRRRGGRVWLHRRSQSRHQLCGHATGWFFDGSRHARRYRVRKLVLSTRFLKKTHPFSLISPVGPQGGCDPEQRHPADPELC
jgi:hypothetical protein